MALRWWYFWLDGSKKSGAGGGWYIQTTSSFQSNQVWETQISRTKLQQVNSIQHAASKDKQSVFGEPSWLFSDALLFFGGNVSSWVSWVDTVWDTWGKIGREGWVIVIGLGLIGGLPEATHKDWFREGILDWFQSWLQQSCDWIDAHKNANTCRKNIPHSKGFLYQGRITTKLTVR